MISVCRRAMLTDEPNSVFACAYLPYMEWHENFYTEFAGSAPILTVLLLNFASVIDLFRRLCRKMGTKKAAKGKTPDVASRKGCTIFLKKWLSINFLGISFKIFEVRISQGQSGGVRTLVEKNVLHARNLHKEM